MNLRFTKAAQRIAHQLAGLAKATLLLGLKEFTFAAVVWDEDTGVNTLATLYNITNLHVRSEAFLRTR